MVGQHPQMYALPETHLLRDERMIDWWERADSAMFPMSDGLLRGIAETVFGEQTEPSIRLARGWLRRRASFTTAHILELLAVRARPLILVEKSPSMVYQPAALERIRSLFPLSKYLHLVRHPRGHGESVIRSIQDSSIHGAVPRWLRDLAAFPNPFGTADEQPVDPQRGWFTLNTNVLNFLASVPGSQRFQVRGEDVLAEPERTLTSICEWLGLQASANDIEEMKHPERGSYSSFGPVGARFGNDVLFLQNPTLRPGRAAQHTLEGSLSWRDDRRGFSQEVKELAKGFGYE